MGQHLFCRRAFVFVALFRSFATTGIIAAPPTSANRQTHFMNLLEGRVPQNHRGASPSLIWGREPKTPQGAKPSALQSMSPRFKSLAPMNQRVIGVKVLNRGVLATPF
jgi:hypothetical protein